MQPTPLQSQLLAKIVLNEMTPLNGQEPTSYNEVEATWADCVIESAQDRGTFTSLVNAGLAFHEGRGRDALAGVTEEGYRVYRRYVRGKYGPNGAPRE